MSMSMSKSMSFAGTRMMAAAARRAFHSQPPSGPLTDIAEESQVISSLYEVAKAKNLSRVPRQLDPSTRVHIALDIEHKISMIRIGASPSEPQGFIYFLKYTNTLSIPKYLTPLTLDY
ncbi:hypothetical protein DAI22_03g241000 [Oryza sativa Japonica Group]|nr:hypothetical protein DAI22_03g241000 [Oryza sativa Japonica Group]